MQRKSGGFQLILRPSVFRGWVSAGALALLLVLSAFLPAGAAHANAIVRVSRPVQIIPWTDHHCGRCHETDALFSHPVDVVPSMQVPASLPLQNGRITCLTCHDDRVEAHAEARAEGTSLLRGEGGNLCAECHNPLDPTRAAQHGSTVGRAHLRWPGRPSPSPTRASPPSFDAETAACLSCHDGLLSSDVAMSRGSTMPSLLDDHPIGVQLTSQPAGPGSTLLMRSADQIDSRIRLFGARVGCNSCHSPYSGEGKLLVMSNRGSELCLNCHINQ